MQSIDHSGSAFDRTFAGQGIAGLLGIGLEADAQSWQERALCAETDPEAFFPEKGGSTREAKKICTGCEVKAQCLEADAEQPGDALPGHAQGVDALARAGAGAEPVSRPLRRTHVVAQPRHLRHDDASPLALVPVRGRREAPEPLSTR